VRPVVEQLGDNPVKSLVGPVSGSWQVRIDYSVRDGAQNRRGRLRIPNERHRNAQARRGRAATRDDEHSLGRWMDAADPRQELVRQLLEYKKFKDAAALLEAQAERQLTRFSRLRVDPPMNIDPAVQPLHAVELWDLVSAFGRLMRETLALQPQQVVVDETPVQIYQDRILQMLEKQPRLAFADIFTPPRTRPRLVGLFLALLELIRTNQIFAHQEQGFGEIWLRLSEDEVQKSEDREQRSEVRGQKSEDRSQSTDDV